jgi:hypothetical protein
MVDFFMAYSSLFGLDFWISGLARNGNTPAAAFLPGNHAGWPGNPSILSLTVWMQGFQTCSSGGMKMSR